MNIVKKYIVIFITILVALILTYFFFWVLNKLSYRYRVDQSYAEIIKDDLKLISDFFSDDVITNVPHFSIPDLIKWKGTHPSVLKWQDYLIKSEDHIINFSKSNEEIIYSIQFSKDQGSTWENLITLNDNEIYGCDLLTVYREKINCISSFQLLTLNQNGKIQKKILTKNADMTYEGIRAAYTKDNKLIFLWPDHRAQIPAFLAFSPPFFYGPSLIMAGELNLDTLEFKEHIIGYDVYDLEELFDKMILNNVFEDPKVNQRIIGRPERGVTITETESGQRIVNIDTSNIPEGESEWSVIEKYIKNR